MTKPQVIEHIARTKKKEKELDEWEFRTTLFFYLVVIAVIGMVFWLS